MRVKEGEKVRLLNLEWCMGSPFDIKSRNGGGVRVRVRVEFD